MNAIKIKNRFISPENFAKEIWDNIPVKSHMRDISSLLVTDGLLPYLIATCSLITEQQKRHFFQRLLTQWHGEYGIELLDMDKVLPLKSLINDAIELSSLAILNNNGHVDKGQASDLIDKMLDVQELVIDEFDREDLHRIRSIMYDFLSGGQESWMRFMNRLNNFNPGQPLLNERNWNACSETLKEMLVLSYRWISINRLNPVSGSKEYEIFDSSIHFISEVTNQLLSSGFSAAFHASEVEVDGYRHPLTTIIIT